MQNCMCVVCRNVRKELSDEDTISALIVENEGKDYKIMKLEEKLKSIAQQLPSFEDVHNDMVGQTFDNTDTLKSIAEKVYATIRKLGNFSLEG